MIKDIKYSGYTAQPSDYQSPDGDLAVSLNLINEDGAMAGIQSPKKEREMPSEGINVLFVHKTATYTHYIAFDTSNFRLRYSVGINGSFVEIPDHSFYSINHINAVGNTLLVFTESDIHYLLWQDNSYTYLGTHLPEVSISFGLVGHPRLYSKSGGETFTVSFAEGISEDAIRNDFSDDNKTKITEQIMAKVNKFIREQTIDKGRFCFPFFVRYALRLYDGSLTMHSAPVLMNPSTLPAPIVLWGRAKGKKSYTEATGCDIMMVAASLDYQVVSNFYNLKDWKDIITGVEVFISKPIYTYDQEGKIANLKDNDNFDCKFIGRLFHKNYHRDGYPQFSKTVEEDCIISTASSTVTISGDSFLDHYMEWYYSLIYKMYFSADRSYPGETFHLPEFSETKNNENIKNCSLFYKLKTIPFEDLNSTDRTDIAIEEDYLQSLVTREVLTDDYLSHDKLVAGASQEYNSRLNLSLVKRKPFAGFSPKTMFAFTDRDACWPTYPKDKPTEWTFYTNNFWGSSLRFTVFIKEGGKVFSMQTSGDDCGDFLSEKLYKSQDDADAHKNFTRSKMSWGCYFFYPNVNAFRVIVYDSSFEPDNYTSGSLNYGGSYVFDLKPHETLNGAYALLDYELRRTPNLTSDSYPATTASPYDWIDCGNKVYTSEVNNPFFFPVTGINTVGTGKILGIATAAKALSQGQFGQFPLYAFTDEGVWAMEVSGTGTYSAKQPITRDVCINADAITQIDSSVLFPTDRGIMLISGSQTQCISDTINSETPFDILSLPGMEKLHSMLGHPADTCLPIAPFSTFLKDCGMLYDYVHQRIIVYNPHYTYSYVFSLKTKAWGMMYSNIKSGINSYPEALAVDSDGNLVNFSADSSDDIKGLLVTRPLKLEAPDVLKTIDTVIQRGHFQKGHVQSVLYGSRDLHHWHLVWSSKDHYLRGFRGTPYKYFRIALLCNLQPGENIFGASLQFNPRLTDQPR